MHTEKEKQLSKEPARSRSKSTFYTKLSPTSDVVAEEPEKQVLPDKPVSSSNEAQVVDADSSKTQSAKKQGVVDSGPASDVMEEEQVSKAVKQVNQVCGEEGTKEDVSTSLEGNDETSVSGKELLSTTLQEKTEECLEGEGEGGKKEEEEEEEGGGLEVWKETEKEREGGGGEKREGMDLSRQPVERESETTPLSTQSRTQTHSSAQHSTDDGTTNTSGSIPVPIPTGPVPEPSDPIPSSGAIGGGSHGNNNDGSKEETDGAVLSLAAPQRDNPIEEAKRRMENMRRLSESRGRETAE